MARLRLVWWIKGIFIHRGHTNPIPGPPPVPQVGLGEAQKYRTGDLAPIVSRYYLTVPMLDHALHHT